VWSSVYTAASWSGQKRYLAQASIHSAHVSAANRASQKPFFGRPAVANSRMCWNAIRMAFSLWMRSAHKSVQLSVQLHARTGCKRGTAALSPSGSSPRSPHPSQVRTAASVLGPFGPLEPVFVGAGGIRFTPPAGSSGRTLASPAVSSSHPHPPAAPVGSGSSCSGTPLSRFDSDAVRERGFPPAAFTSSCSVHASAGVSNFGSESVHGVLDVRWRTGERPLFGWIGTISRRLHPSLQKKPHQKTTTETHSYQPERMC
jgi:hypothetical protein